MATKFITPSWRMPKNSNQSKASNYSIDFDGSTQFIDLGSNIVLGTNKYSFSFWLKTSSTTTQSVIGTRNDNTDGWIIQIEEDLILFYNVKSSSNRIASDKDITDGNWHHVVVVRGGTASTNKIYVDGASQNLTYNNENLTNPASTLSMKIGVQYHSSQFERHFNGKMGPVSIFDYELDSNAVTALYNSGIPANPLAVTTPPVAYYDLGQGSAYASGSAGIIEPNLAQATGSTVFEFDGPNANEQYITTTYFPNGESNFTYSTWVNCNFYQRGAPLAAYGGSTHQNFYVTFWGSTGGVMYVYVGAGVYGLFNNFALHGYSINEWTNISIVYDGTFTDADTATQNAGRLKLYINGNYEAFDSFSGTIPNTIPSGNTGFYLGTTTPTTYEYGGKMSNVQMWNTTLSAPNVATLYNNGTPLQSNIPQSGSLKAWYKLGLDSSAYSDSKWTISDTSVNYKNSLGFNFVDSLVSTGLNMSYANRPNFSLSYWMRFDSTDSRLSNFITVFAIGIGNQNPAYNYALGRIYHQSSGAGAIVNWQSNASYNGTTNVGDNQWHNIVYTVQDNGDNTQTIKAFVDGNSTPEWEAPTLTYLKLSGDLFFGFFKDGANGQYDKHFLGQVSNVAVWYENGKEDQSSNLTNIYNNGTPQTSYTDTPSNWWKLDNLTEGLKDSTGNNNATNDGSIVSGVAVSQNNGLSSGMDTTNLVPSNLIKSIPYSGYSMDFDGTFDYIDFGDSDNFSFTNNSSTDLPFVLSWWLKPDSMNQNQGIAIIKNTEYQLKTDSTGRLKVTLYDSTDGGDIDTAITTANWLYDGAYIWKNIIVTYDGSGNNTGIDIFLDGEHRGDVVRSGSGTYNFMRNSANSLINGDVGSVEFDGKQSNFAAWKNRTMMTGSNEDSIIRIYNEGSPGDLSNLSPTSWWSLGADSYFDGTNWICPDLGSGGSNGTSANMGAEVLVGDGPDSLANGTSTNLDLASDLIGEAPGSTGNAISINMNSLARTGSTP